MRSVLTIAGSDSGGGAGIQGDLKTLAAHGVYAATAITALTAQNTTGIISTVALEADFVTEQIEAVAGDLHIDATKTGMLATAAIVEAVAAAIEELELPLVVVDPVLVSSSGTRLLDDDGIRSLCFELIPRCRVVTPNIPEAEVLSGRRIRSLHDAHDAARRVRDMGAEAVIIKGGHADGDDVVDVLVDGDTLVEFRRPRERTRPTHGTGCAYAAAVAAELALGFTLAEAAARAQEYVGGAIRHAEAVGKGRLALDHFWRARA